MVYLTKLQGMIRLEMWQRRYWLYKMATMDAFAQLPWYEDNEFASLAQAVSKELCP